MRNISNQILFTIGHIIKLYTLDCLGHESRVFSHRFENMVLDNSIHSR